VIDVLRTKSTQDGAGCGDLLVHLDEGVLKSMFLTKLKAGAVVLLASCTIASPTTLATERAQADRDDGRPVAASAAVAVVSPGPPQDPAANAAARAEKPPAAGGDGGVRSRGRILTPDGKLMCVNVYTTDLNADQKDLVNFANVFVMPRLWRIKSMGIAKNLGDRIFAMRIRLNPDRMRAYNLSSEDITKALDEMTIIGPNDRLGQATGKMSQSKEYVLTYIGHYNKPEQYKNIILKASPDGEILRIKDIGQVELGTQFFEFNSDVDGHPAATIVLKRAPGSNAAEVIEAVKEELAHIKKESCPPGMEFEVIPLENQGMIYAVIETTRGSTLEYMSAKCHELEAIGKGINGIASVSSLAGYQIRTEDRGSDAATCLIRLNNRSDRKRTSRQIIEELEEKCRTMNVHLEFFEPPAVSVFVAAGGFSVRVLDRTNSHSDRRPGSGPETFMDDLLKRKNPEGLFTFLAGNYPQYELVINNDVAIRKGVSIADAMENLPTVVGGDVQAERTFRSLVEDLSHLFVKNGRGEMVPYSLFMQLKKKQGLNEIDR
jgi:multidrug efflux pump subunit AcrB